MPAPKEILDLVERFKRNREEYESGKYNETQLRREFLDPFFKALGWDIANEKGRAEAYKEVIHEDAIKIGSATKAPDYCFRIGGTRKFFLEAKKPSVNIKDDLSPAFQLRRYAWSAKLPLSILSDFEEFAVYDCRVKPYKNDKSNTARLMYFTFDQYVDKWDGIASIFSQEAVLDGSFDKFADSSKGKKGTTTVDEAFLEEIERWRSELAKNIASKNSKLTVEELNFSVQKIIDRIIFLRISEDRGIEQYGKLLSLSNGTKVYDRLTQLFQRADEKFNSGLFHFQREKDRPEQPDELTLDLKIDDKIFKDMIGGLYYPESPYEFSALPADILGQVYEQFLGKVIRLTDGHQAKVEDKPEVKKAGGVFYTPTYIVEYIVKNTVGKLCEGKSPKQITKLRILDPACGSGSFLIEAYQYLLDWHRDWYVNDNPQNHQKELYQGPGGDWRLTTDSRKKILLNNIYGVDIDAQAVEVTKLSLLLKVLEGESDQTLKKQLEIFHQRALPDLGSNIKCGNSLVGPEVFKAQLIPDEKVYKRVNPFDWKQEFPEIFSNNGFDCIVGNPPYVKSGSFKESNPDSWEFCRSLYRSASSREWDIYLVFVEKGLRLLKPSGVLGFILPNKFLNSQAGENLRAIISEGKNLDALVHFGAFQIFPQVTTYTCLLFLNNSQRDRAKVARYIGQEDTSKERCPLPSESPIFWKTSEILSSSLTSNVWDVSSANSSILQKIKVHPPLGNIAQIFQGTGTRADKVYFVEGRGKDGKLIRIYSNEKEKEYSVEPTYLKPGLRGRSIKPYSVEEENLLLIVPYEKVNGKYELSAEKKLVASSPKLLKYLQECKDRLNEREEGRFKGEGWFCYGRPQNLDRFEVPEKIVLPDVANRGSCYLDKDGKWLLDTAYAIVLKPGINMDLRFILAILNSPLLYCYLKDMGSALRGGYFRMKTAYLNPFPIRLINFSNVEEKTKYDRIIILVDQMIGLRKKALDSKNESNLFERQIKSVNSEIDGLIYELYDLSAEDIKLIENR
jgi:type I restriction-modification system DNA methylase subunit